MKIFTSTVMLFLWSLWIDVAYAQMDWPQLRGPKWDGISEEMGLLKNWPKRGPKVLWKKRVGEGFSGISVSDGRA